MSCVGGRNVMRAAQWQLTQDPMLLDRPERRYIRAGFVRGKYVNDRDCRYVDERWEGAMLNR